MPACLLNIAYWVHDLNPIILDLPGPLAIRWYGVAYLLGFASAGGLLYLYWRRGRTELNPDQLTDLFFIIGFCALIGGRVGFFLLYDFSALVQDPLVLVRIYEGGMASHGGIIGTIFGIFLAARKLGVSFWHVSDLISTILAPGVFLGRLANFINGELWGKVSDVSWAVVFPHSAPGWVQLEQIPPRHPSQLYEAMLEGLVFGLYMQVRFWISGKKLPPGQIFGESLIVYALMRIIGEQFREPDASLIFGMSRGIFYSLFMVLVGLGVITHRSRKEPRMS